MEVDKKIKESFNVLNQIQEVEISSSFKEQVLDKVLEIKEEAIVVEWFSPRLQLVAMIIVLLVNTGVILYSLRTSSPETSINSFAEAYSLSSSTTSLILN